jgi:hypothetical protein
MALYEELVEQHLRIPQDFVTSRQQEIHDKIRGAGQALVEGRKNDAIDRIMYLASIVILRNPEHLDATERHVNETFPTRTSHGFPHTNAIISSAVIRYLLDRAALGPSNKSEPVASV